MSNPSCPIGQNRLAQMTPIIAKRCGFENVSKHKPHGKHAFGVTMLSNSSVSEQMKLKCSRHSSIKTHARYQRMTDANINKK